MACLNKMRKRWMATLFLLLSTCRVSQAQEIFAVPMRDRVKLTTKVWYSESKDLRKPVVLSRAYNASVAGQSRFNAAGYHCAGQATRCGGGVDGSRFMYDAQDGYDCIDWISKQPWCDGNVVMYGKSYWGKTQLLAAMEQHPTLKAIVPQNMGIGSWKSGYRCYGAVALAMTAHGRAGNRCPYRKFDPSLLARTYDKMVRLISTIFW